MREGHLCSNGIMRPDLEWPVSHALPYCIAPTYCWCSIAGRALLGQLGASVQCINMRVPHSMLKPREGGAVPAGAALLMV